MSEALYRKYRPRKLKDIVGQGHVKQYLANAVKNDKLSHAYLFVGPRGTGKTTLARILAMIINCDNGPSLDYDINSKVCKSIIEESCLDVREMDAGDKSSVEDIRNIKKLAGTYPVMCRKRVFIIDECHRLSGAASTALLKTLEEPPETSVFILATTEPQKILETIQSRCQKFNLRNISEEEIVKHLIFVAKSEGVKKGNKEAFFKIARYARGSMRDALSGLESVIEHGDGEVMPETVSDLLGSCFNHLSFSNLIDSIASLDYKESINIVKKELKSGTDPSSLFMDILNFSHDMLLSKTLQTSGFIVMEKENKEEWDSIVDKYSLDVFLLIHKNIMKYANISLETVRSDISMETCVIDTISKLSCLKNN